MDRDEFGATMMGKKARHIKNLEIKNHRLYEKNGALEIKRRGLEADNKRLKDLVTLWQKRFDTQQEKLDEIRSEK